MRREAAPTRKRRATTSLYLTLEMRDNLNGVIPCRSGVTAQHNLANILYTLTLTSSISSHLVHLEGTKLTDGSDLSSPQTSHSHQSRAFQHMLPQRQPFPISMTPDHAMPEARGNLQILWPRGSSHVPSGLLMRNDGAN